jgi:hypothetical protein
MPSVAIWKRRAMLRTGLSGNTMPPTPQNRLVASELEARWNRAFAHRR